MRFREQASNLFRLLSIAGKDESFLKAISKFENVLSKILAIVLIFVIFIAVFDLLRLLTYDLFLTEPKGLFTAPLVKIFGMFLNVLIALELLENITAYLRQQAIQLELVVVTALTAVARKIIIFDSKTDGDLSSLAIAVLSLSISYWIVRSQKSVRKH